MVVNLAKKKPEDKQQTSLFSFVEKSKSKAQAPKKLLKKVAPKKKPEKIVDKKPEIKDKPEIQEKKEKIPIPKKLFFTGNKEPFGLKEGDIQLETIQRESLSSKYLRYLIEKGEIVENLERGMLLDVDYDGRQNKAYCKFYDLDSDEIKIWIDTTDHQPYCLSKESIAELETNIKLTDYQGFSRFEEI